MVPGCCSSSAIAHSMVLEIVSTVARNISVRNVLITSLSMVSSPSSFPCFRDMSSITSSMSFSPELPPPASRRRRIRRSICSSISW
uniref:Uncharacterized protein n=1 Tax=Arundo donax TaxID=35708 RepID=A0A0A9ASM8_ARUDO